MVYIWNSLPDASLSKTFAFLQPYLLHAGLSLQYANKLLVYMKVYYRSTTYIVRIRTHNLMQTHLFDDTKDGVAGRMDTSFIAPFGSILYHAASITSC